MNDKIYCKINNKTKIRNNVNNLDCQKKMKKWLEFR